MIGPLKPAPSAERNFQYQVPRLSAAANVVSRGHYGRFGSTHRFGTRRVDLDSHLAERPKPAPSAAKVTAAAKASGVSQPTLGTAGSPARQFARPAAATEHDRLDLAFDLQRSTFEDATPSVCGGSDRELTPEALSAADAQDVPRRWPGNETAQTRESGPEIVTREPRSLVRDVTSQSSATQRATAMVPLATAERRPMSRVALVVALPTMALIAIGVSVYAYYVYSHSLQLTESNGARAVSTGPADVNAGEPPTRPIPKIGVGASSAPSSSLGTGSAAAIETVKPAPPIGSSTAVATSPAGPGTTVATGSNGASSQRPSPSEAPPQVSTSGQVTPAQQFAANTDGVVKERTAATAVAKDLRHRTMPAAGNEVTAKHSSRVKVRPDVPRPRACTEGAAALGLCSSKSRGERPKSPVVKACSQQERILGLCG